MARAALRLLSPLWLLSLSWAPPGAATGTVSVQAPPEVLGLLGESVTLPCHLQSLEPDTNVTQQTWVHLKLAGPNRAMAVFHPKKGPNVQEPERVRFVAAHVDLRNASLTLSDLRAEDEGTYVCQIATFPGGSGSASIRLLVKASPQSTVELLEVPLHPIPGKWVPVARCVSSGGRPPPRISWSLNDSNLKATVEEPKPGPLPGTSNVTSLLYVVPSSQVDGKNVTCIVEHERLVEPHVRPVTLSVPYLPEVSISGYDDDWYLGQKGVSLNCDVRSNPEPRSVVWNTTTGYLPHSAEAQDRRLLIHTVDESINTTFICLATNALGTGQAEQTVLPRGPPLGAQSVSITAIIVVLSLLMVVVVGFLFYCLSSRLCGRCQRSRSASRANGVNGVSYAKVRQQSSPPEDTPTEVTR